MVSAIILLLALLTAGLVVGVFIMALIELNHIDEIASAYCTGSETLPVPSSTTSASQA